MASRQQTYLAPQSLNQLVLLGEAFGISESTDQPPRRTLTHFVNRLREVIVNVLQVGYYRDQVAERHRLADREENRADEIRQPVGLRARLSEQLNVAPEQFPNRLRGQRGDALSLPLAPGGEPSDDAGTRVLPEHQPGVVGELIPQLVLQAAPEGVSAA